MLFYRNTGGLSVKANSFYLQSHCMLSFDPCELKWISRNFMIMPGLWPTFTPAHVIPEDQPHSVNLAPPNFDLCKSVPLFFFFFMATEASNSVFKAVTLCVNQVRDTHSGLLWHRVGLQSRRLGQRTQALQSIRGPKHDPAAVLHYVS